MRTHNLTVTAPEVMKLRERTIFGGQSFPIIPDCARNFEVVPNRCRTLCKAPKSVRPMDAKNMFFLWSVEIRNVSAPWNSHVEHDSCHRATKTEAWTWRIHARYHPTLVDESIQHFWVSVSLWKGGNFDSNSRDLFPICNTAPLHHPEVDWILHDRKHRRNDIFILHSFFNYM